MSPSLTSTPSCSRGHRRGPRVHGAGGCRVSSGHLHLFISLLLFFSLHFSTSMLKPKALFSEKSQCGGIWGLRNGCCPVSHWLETAGQGTLHACPSHGLLQESCSQRPLGSGKEPPPRRHPGQSTGSPCPPAIGGASSHCLPPLPELYFFFPTDLCGLL